MAGLLVVLEGLDFSGKSLQREKVADMLEGLGHEVVRTREVGGTPMAERLRELYLQGELTPKAELLVIQAARAEHVDRVIRPAVQAGKIVLCDRFYPSTYAWQVHPTLSEDHTDLLALFGETLRLVVNDIGPTVQFYLDVPGEVRAARHKELGTRDLWEEKPAEIIAKVEEAYAEIVSRGDLYSVNANIPAEELTVALVKLIEQAKQDADALPTEHPQLPEAEQPTPTDVVPDDKLPPVREFIEHSISTHFQPLIGLMPDNLVKRFRDIALDKSTKLQEELVAKGLKGHELYQQLDHGMRYIAQMAYNYEASSQLLDAHATRNNLRPVTRAVKSRAKPTRKRS